MRPTERSAPHLGRGSPQPLGKVGIRCPGGKGRCEWRSRGGRNPSWGRESPAFGEDIRNEEEERVLGGKQSLLGGLRVLRKSRGRGTWAREALQRWGGRPEHASPGRPKLPRRAAGLDRGEGCRVPGPLPLQGNCRGLPAPRPSPLPHLPGVVGATGRTPRVLGAEAGGRTAWWRCPRKAQRRGRACSPGARPRPPLPRPARREEPSEITLSQRDGESPWAPQQCSLPPRLPHGAVFGDLSGAQPRGEPPRGSTGTKPCLWGPTV